MKTRMEKYYSEQEPSLSRAQRNANLYKEVNDSELDDFNLNSNASVLGDNTPNIDLQKIQEILDKKYSVEPKRKTNINVEPLPVETLDLDETREYDINAILDKARENKEVDYEVDRLKKLRNTQYDILNNLDLEKNKEEDMDVTSEQAKLMDLINTITSKEMANEINKKLEESESSKELDPLDLFSDLKGDDDATTTLGAIKEELLEEAKKNTEAKEQSIPTKEFEIKDKAIDVTAEIKPIEPPKEKDEQYFTTSSLQFSQSDFDDFNDLKDDMKAAKIIIKVLIVLIIIAFAVGCLFLANNIFDLGLF